MPEYKSNNSSVTTFLQDLIPTSSYTLFREERTFLVLIGLAVSIALAVSINDEIKSDIWKFIFG